MDREAHQAARKIAIDKANRTLAVVAAARALVAAPAGDPEARKRLVQALEKYDRSSGPTPREGTESDALGDREHPGPTT